jgi:hypothetical protein
MSTSAAAAFFHTPADCSCRRYRMNFPKTFIYNLLNLFNICQIFPAGDIFEVFCKLLLLRFIELLLYILIIKDFFQTLKT